MIEAPVQLLRIILYEIVRTEENHSEFIALLDSDGDTPTGDKLPFVPVKIRFKRLPTSPQVIYLSALPHLLTSHSQHKTTQIASEIVTLLCTYITGYGTDFVYPELPREVVRNLAVEALPSGLIAFELWDGAIAYWLNLILHHTFIRASSVNLPSIPALSSRLFAIQHSHARCCSLLRLAHREQLVILNQPDAEPNQWTFISPTTISWLDASSQLHSKSSSERDLISWLLRALDAIAEPSPLRAKQILLLAEEGSRLFQVLHQTHPLFGDFRTQPRDRIHAHLALVLATQRMLSQLLHQLSASAPKEL